METNQESVTVLHLVGPEPHPAGPDTNLDSGKLLMNYWSTARQPLNMADRQLMATKVRCLSVRV